MHLVFNRFVLDCRIWKEWRKYPYDSWCFSFDGCRELVHSNSLLRILDKLDIRGLIVLILTA